MAAKDAEMAAKTLIAGAGSRSGNISSSGSIQEATRSKKIAIVSPPEFGPDGEGGYTFPVSIMSRRRAQHSARRNGPLQ
jgi:hypothetical protein